MAEGSKGAETPSGLTICGIQEGSAPPGISHCLERGQGPGGREAEVRPPPGEGCRLNGNWGPSWAPAMCFRTHRLGCT